jgi:hypothetical protein
MEKVDKFMVKILIMMGNLIREENKVWVFIIGMPNNITQVVL